jgi:hypothetical protein
VILRQPKHATNPAILWLQSSPLVGRVAELFVVRRHGHERRDCALSNTEHGETVA